MKPRAPTWETDNLSALLEQIQITDTPSSMSAENHAAEDFDLDSGDVEGELSDWVESIISPVHSKYRQENCAKANKSHSLPVESDEGPKSSLLQEFGITDLSGYNIGPHPTSVPSDQSFWFPGFSHGPSTYYRTYVANVTSLYPSQQIGLGSQLIGPQPTVPQSMATQPMTSRPLGPTQHQMLSFSQTPQSQPQAFPQYKPRTVYPSLHFPATKVHTQQPLEKPLPYPYHPPQPLLPSAYSQPFFPQAQYPSYDYNLRPYESGIPYSAQQSMSLPPVPDQPKLQIDNSALYHNSQEKEFFSDREVNLFTAPATETSRPKYPYDTESLPPTNFAEFSFQNDISSLAPNFNSKSNHLPNLKGNFPSLQWDDPDNDNELTASDKNVPQLKKQLQLSPASKQQFTDFFKQFKTKEKEGFASAKHFAASHLHNLPPKVHWKVFLEIADLAKRENKLKEARKYFEVVNFIQPYACKGWLEYAKMEEESGNLDQCTRILADGLFFCPHSESLLVKGIKHSERMGAIGAARALLSRLKNVAVERSWRTMMEGGLLEARQGNFGIARQIFKYLIDKVPSYGPIYTEAVRLEMRIEDYGRAIRLVEKGLSRIPSYGPLWFLALKLDELTGGDFALRVANAVPNLSKELVWKIYFELGQIYERSLVPGDCFLARKAYVQAVLNCPSRNLIWKIWLAGARTELRYYQTANTATSTASTMTTAATATTKNSTISAFPGNLDVARKLLVRALQTVPPKMKSTTLVECCRFEEYLGDLEQARYILAKAKKEAKQEWKVFLEGVLLEMRANDLDSALREVREALEIHNTTGRLWAMLIQLTHLRNIGADNVKDQTKVFRKALNSVPKSGEVWCEGARIALYQGAFDQARKYLTFAVQFTPQYGDSFIEQLRLEILTAMKDSNSLDLSQVLEMPSTRATLQKLELACMNAEPTYGVCWTFCKEHPLDSPSQALRNARTKYIALLNSVTQEGGEICWSRIASALDIATAYFTNSCPDVNPNESRFKGIFS